MLFYFFLTIVIIIAVTKLFKHFASDKDTAKQQQKEGQQPDIKNNKKQSNKEKSIKTQTPEEQKEIIKEDQASKESKVSYKEIIKSQHKTEKGNKKKVQQAQITHKLYINSLKGFADLITDVQSNQQYVFIVSRDKTMKVFDILTIKDENPHFFFKTFNYNVPTALGVSNNGNLVAVGLENDKTIEIYQFNPKTDKPKEIFQLNKRFQNDCHKENIILLSFGENNSFLISCAQSSDTIIKVWSLDGSLLHQYNTNQIQHYQACISQRFVFVASWSPTVKGLEVKQVKENKNFKTIEKAIEFSGHKTSVTNISVNNSEDRVITASKDSNVKFWNIAVKYEMKEDAKLLCELQGDEITTLFVNQSNNQIVSSASYYHKDKKIFIYVLTNGKSIIILNEQFKKIEKIDDIVSDEAQINRLQIMEFKSAVLLLCMSAQEARISVFKLNDFFK